MADVDSLVSFTGDLRALDHRHGGGHCRGSAVSRLPSALALFDHPVADEVFGPLCTAVADLHNLAGWSCFDIGLTAEAVRHFRMALAVAARNDHTAPASNLYYRLGRMSLHHNDVAYTELARTADPRYAESAAAVLSTAIDGYGPGMARSRAFSLISLATCHLLDDQVDAAVELGNEAVDFRVAPEQVILGGLVRAKRRCRRCSS
jgi:hypothetical protein